MKMGNIDLKFNTSEINLLIILKQIEKIYRT